jgi:hypothetical protein
MLIRPESTRKRIGSLSFPDPRDLRGRSWETIKQAVLASARL